MSDKKKRQNKKHMIPVIRILNPFDARDHERTELQWHAKKTLAEYFPLFESQPIVLSVSGRIVEPENFAVTYLDKTDNVVLCPIPAGGGSGKKILMMVAIIALAVITMGSSLALMGVLYKAGSVLLNAIFAPPKPSAPGETKASYGLDGAKNTSLEGIPVPVCYGSFRTAGNILGLYTTSDGDDNQTLYMLISAGEGPIASITDIEINDNPLTDYHDVEVQTRLGLATQSVIPWFNDTVTSINKSQKLTTDWFYSTTTKPADKVRLDFVAPTGLGEIDTKSGDVKNAFVNIDAEYRKVGDADWKQLPVEGDIDQWNYATYNTVEERFGATLDKMIQERDANYLSKTGPVIVQDGKLMSRFPTYAQGIRINGNKKSAVRRSYSSTQLDNSQYEIRVRRNTPKSTKDNILDEIYLSDISEITLDDMTYPNTALLALKIKMTDQLSNLPNVTFMNGGRVITTYKNNQWGVEASQNPAWVVWDILTHPRYGGAMPAARLDLVAFQEFADYCEAAGLTWNGPMESETNIWDACQLVLRVGHSQLVPSGTRYTVITEKPAAPVMMFSVANMIEGSYKETWLGTVDRANEIDVTFFDKTDKYKQRTIKVYDPVALSSGAPQRNSAITLYGVVDYDRAYKEAQFQLNLNRYILKTISFSAPLEAIACRVGDLILVQTDLTDWAHAGRFDAGSTASVMNLDRPVTMAAGKNYNLLTVRDAVQRSTGAVTKVIGSSVYLQGIDPSGMSVKRIQIGARDVAVDATFAGGVIVQDSTGIAPGQNYSLWDTDVIEEHTVVNVPGTSSSIILQTPLNQAPDQFAKWMFGEAEKVKKPFRVKSVSGDSEYRRDISAIEYREEVYDHTRYGSNVAVPTDPKAPIGMVGNLSVFEETYVAGSSIVSSVVASWTASVVGMYAGADVYVERNGAVAEKFSSLPNRTSIVIPADRGDVLKVRVVAFDIFGKRSQYESAPVATYTVIGEVKLDVASPTGAGFIWSGRDCKINWRYNATTHSYEFGSEPNGADAGALDPHFKDYQIKIYEKDGKTLRRTEYTTDNSYVYIFDKNFSDGLARHLVFEIRMRDTFNNLGNPAILEASNPPPTVTSMNSVASFDSATISYEHSGDPDFAGAIVWLSRNSSNLNNSAPNDGYQVYSGPDSMLTLPALMFAADYYYRIAAYDAFGASELVMSPMGHFKTTNLDVAAIADGVLGDSKLIPALQSRINKIDAPESGLIDQLSTLGQKVLELSDAFETNGGDVYARAQSYVQQYAYAKSAVDSSIATSATNITSAYKSYADQAKTDAVTAAAADVRSYGYSKTATDSAISTKFDSITSNYTTADSGVLSSAQSYVQNYSYSKAEANSAIATQISQVSARLDKAGVGSTTIEQAFTAQANTNTGLLSQYSIKIDSNGYVSGFGLTSTTSAAGASTSEFVINADKFGVVMPSYPGVKPFTVGVVNGTPRVILSNALIGDASISSAMIGDAQVNSLKIAGEAVTVPIVSAAVGGLKGRGETTYSVINEGWINLSQAGMVYILVTAAQGFRANDRFWCFQIWVNGALSRTINGHQANDAVAMSSTLGLPAGTHHVEVKWAGHSDVTQGYSDLLMMGVKK